MENRNSGIETEIVCVEINMTKDDAYRNQFDLGRRGDANG